jgi:hypothetical protein
MTTASTKVRTIPAHKQLSTPAPGLLNARPKKRRRPLPSSGSMTYCHHCRCNTRKPKMRCTLIDTSASERCRTIYRDSGTEKRYTMRLILPHKLSNSRSPGTQVPDITFNLFAETCPFCSGYCNCSLCAPKRGEKYVPERNRGGSRGRVAVRTIPLMYLLLLHVPPRLRARANPG